MHLNRTLWMQKTKILTWFGPPASGKGTYTKLVGERLSSKPAKVTVSDIIRQEIADKTEDGMKMKEYYDQSYIVPAELLMGTLAKKLKSLPQVKEGGVVFLDGFPRSKEQAGLILELMEEVNAEWSCIHLDLRRDISRLKTFGRLICPKCDHSYNDAHIDEPNFKMPKDMPDEPKCSIPRTECGFENLERRVDMEKFEQRYDIFQSSEEPAVEWFKQRVKSTTVPITGGYAVMTDIIEKEVKKLLDE